MVFGVVDLLELFGLSDGALSFVDSSLPVLPVCKTRVLNLVKIGDDVISLYLGWGTKAERVISNLPIKEKSFEFKIILNSFWGASGFMKVLSGNL